MSTVVEERTVGQVMTSEVVQARPDTSFEELARMLIVHRIGGLPVVDDDDKVMGVVSRKDLARQQAVSAGTTPGGIGWRTHHGDRPTPTPSRDPPWRQAS